MGVVARQLEAGLPRLAAHTQSAAKPDGVALDNYTQRDIELGSATEQQALKGLIHEISFVTHRR